MCVCVGVDKPTPPVGPLEVLDVFKDRCRLQWKPPKDDGGEPVDHYRVEKQDTATGKWEEVSQAHYFLCVI